MNAAINPMTRPQVVSSSSLRAQPSSQAPAHYGVGRAVCLYHSSVSQAAKPARTQSPSKPCESEIKANPIAAYEQAFGQAVPREIIRKAALRLCLQELEDTLANQVRRGVAIYSWEYFRSRFTQPKAEDAYECWALPLGSAAASLQEPDHRPTI